MKTSLRTEEDLEVLVYLGGPYEDFRVEEVCLVGPDNEQWYLNEKEARELDLIDDDNLEQLAYDNAYELDVDHMSAQADFLYDQWKERDL